MKETVIRALFMWLILFIMLQPIFTYIDYLLDLQVKANTSYLAQKAATEGIVTSSLKNEVVHNLEALGFSPSSISVTGSTEAVQNREARIDVYIRVPRIPMFPYFFGTAKQPEEYYGHGSVMSEYVE
ncbi:hypothetical protein F4V43_09950 [Paenibacillus spiritus]|uniref:DUF4320 family protein n=1 Tax=Paenibacillus spiritus TaxID=2496557 RepID=A0A5J5GBX2_9BACL|nr:MULTISPECIES: hypothetical protein [Paenibacillus]KAA9004934.1 hypothetical protein F4V43_09950 [Paenibacillus spiritus]